MVHVETNQKKFSFDNRSNICHIVLVQSFTVGRRFYYQLVVCCGVLLFMKGNSRSMVTEKEDKSRFLYYNLDLMFSVQVKNMYTKITKELM